MTWHDEPIDRDCPNCQQPMRVVYLFVDGVQWQCKRCGKIEEVGNPKP